MLNISQHLKSEKFKSAFYHVRFIYFCFLLVYALSREIAPLYDIVDSAWLSYFFFGTGLLLIGTTFLVDRKIFLKRHSIIMLAFIAVCILSSLINIQLGLIDNLKAIGWMTIYFFVAFFCALTPHKNNTGYITAITAVVVVFLGIFVALSIPMYIYNVDYTYFNFNAAMVTSNQGFSLEYVRLWGVFNEANRGAVYSLIGMASAIYLFITKKKVVVRILTVLAALLFLTFIVLSQSRTALLISLIVCAWCTFYFAFQKFSFKIPARLGISVVLAVAAAIAFYGVVFTVQNALPYAKQAIYNHSSMSTITAVHKGYDSIYKNTSLNIIAGLWDDQASNPSPTPDNPAGSQPDPNNPPGSSKPSIEFEELQRPDVNKDDNLSNGRIKRWKDGLKIFTKTPIWGTSPRYVSNYAKIHCPETYIAQYDYVIHNGYLEVLVGTGILGFLPILVIILSAAWIALKKFLKSGFDLKFMLMVLVAVTFLCMSVLQTEVFFILTFGGALFWYSLGALSHAEE